MLLDGNAHLGVIGNTRPTGLCGSGLIDLAAELLRRGIVSPEGRLLEKDELPATLAGPLRERVISHGEGQPEFLLADKDSRGRGNRLTLTQRDVRELQLATGRSGRASRSSASRRGSRPRT